MKKYHFLLTMLLLAVFANNANAQVCNDNEDGVYKIQKHQQKDLVPGQVLFKLKDGHQANVRRAAGRVQSAGISSLDAVLSEYAVEEMEQLLPNVKVSGTPRRAKAFNGTTIVERDLTQLYKLTLSEEKMHETMQLIEKLEVLPEVEFAEPNYKAYLTDTEIAGSFFGNPYVTQQWYLDAYGVKQLWNKPIVNPKRPVIAIIDTGVDLTHPDLAPNLWTNQAEAEGETGYDNDGNGFAGDVHGWDFINNTPNVKDFNMHGTHVAGIAAAANNGIGIIGANPQALIMPISVMQSDGTGDVATIIKGINYAVQNGADVLNLSLGTYANSRALRQALEKAYQTAVIVAAAGNDGRCINTPHHPSPCYGAAPMFPAAYSFVLGVQATQSNGSLAGFSNYDDDGNTFSAATTLQDPDGFNYELKAPGTDMLSTIPGGKYKALNGTSMAAPLVAGSISALMMVKNYDSQEILWGDLLHTDNIAQAYAVTNRPAELDLMKIMYRERKELADETEDDYSNDGEIDAGETVSLYPVIRTTFGAASNIKMKLEMGELEDPNTVEILTPDWVDFGMHLDAYGKGVSLNPMQLRVASNVADNRHIKMKFTAKCDEANTFYEGHFTMVVNNMVKIGGMLSENKTLTSDKTYHVNQSIGVPQGITLTIEPGTHLLFDKGMGISVEGDLIANGTPENHIIMDSRPGQSYWGGIIAPNSTISYCELYKCDMSHGQYGVNAYNDPYMEDCILSNQGRNSHSGFTYSFDNIRGVRCNIIYNYWPFNYSGLSKTLKESNIVNNQYRSEWNGGVETLAHWSNMNRLNFFNNFTNDMIDGKYYSFGINTTNATIETNTTPSYLGSSSVSIVRKYIWEIGNATNTFGSVDLSNMRTIPIAEAHGIVWKVLVNGKDAQDEYEDLAPLGVGKHKFEVYFNRPMNKAVAPQISFGLRDPYTQQVVNEEGEGSGWNAEGTIYTAYKTITGKTKSDGINRIYVYGAEDDEYFEIPYEKTRFNINVQAAGSMATGFAGEAQMGRVKLTWNNENNDFEDAMGFNIYRFGEEYEKTLPAGYYNGITPTEWGVGTYYDERTVMVADTIRINQEIVDIETTEYTDYDVTPGQTYYYMYKVLSTDLKEYDVSNVVAVTPLTATLGDANGSGDVDVADVITTVNYAAGQDPKPFIFEAADVNTDLAIDILDVIGIIQKILNPSATPTIMAEATAVYTIENGVLYVESPVALAGVQVQLNLDAQKDIKVAEDLDGFEHTSAWLTDNDYLFLAYNLNGKTLSAGKHALLHIGDADVSSLRLSDAQGHNVMVEAGEGTTNISAMGSKVMNQKGIYDLQGRKVTTLKKGVYIINGKKVVK